LNSNYVANPDGSRTLTTTSPGITGQGPGGGFDDITAFMMDMMRRRAAQEDEARRAAQYQAYKPKSALGHGAARPPAQRSVSNEVGGMQQQLRGAQYLAEMEKMRAMTSSAPVKMVNGPGVVPGYTPDTLAMSGIQRQVYNPSGSGMSPGGAETLGTQRDHFEDFDWVRNYQKRQQEFRERGY
jgi:hypothetical protein